MPSVITLRDYQLEVVEKVRESIRRGNRRILIVAPTGAGKTVIASHIIKAAEAKNRYVNFLAHRRELINQTSKKLIQFGVEHGILMSGEVPYGATNVQVSSVDTLRARCINTDKMILPHADIVFTDEAHRSLAPTYLKIYDRYGRAIMIGLTATPIRSDGKGLGHVYDDMVLCPSIGELIQMGYLAVPRHFCPTIPDLTGVPIRKGDYDPKALDRAMRRRSLVGDVVSHWFRLASDRPSIVFASGVKHSINLRDEFRKAGVKAAHVDGETPKPERDKIIAGLHVGEIQVVCNYGVLTEGFDEPKLSAGIIARPTKNLGLYIQMAGRVLRVADEKEDALIIDHSGNVYEHGFVQDNHQWVLTEGKALADSNEERQKKLDEKEPITCVNCAYTYTKQLVCPNCGHKPEKKGKFYDSRAGDLMEVRAEKRRTAKKRKFTYEDKRSWYRQLQGYALDKNKSDGWVAHTYKSKFNAWPNVFNVKNDPPIKAEGEVLGYIRHRQIRYAKRKEKEKAANAG